MRPNYRVTEANRRLLIYDRGLGYLTDFLRIIERGSLQPEVVQRGSEEAVRFPNQRPEEALLLKYGRLVSLNRVMLLLMDQGFVQEQAIIQRCIEETNESIMFVSINLTGSGSSDKFDSHLSEFWKEDYSDPNDPIGTAVPRAFTRKGIGPFLNRVFQQPNPSAADGAMKAIYGMYSGFTHGAAPQILELYNYEQRTFCDSGIKGTNRHIDYIFDVQNSLYRSLFSAVAVAKAFGSKELTQIAQDCVNKFESMIGIKELKAGELDQ